MASIKDWNTAKNSVHKSWGNVRENNDGKGCPCFQWRTASGVQLNAL